MKNLPSFDEFVNEQYNQLLDEAAYVLDIDGNKVFKGQGIALTDGDVGVILSVVRPAKGSDKGAVKVKMSDGSVQNWTGDEIYLNEENANVNESAFTRLADTDEQEESIAKIEKWMKKIGRKIVGGTPMPEASRPRTTILDLTHNGSEIYVETDGSIEVYGEPAEDFNEFKELVSSGPSENYKAPELNRVNED